MDQPSADAAGAILTIDLDAIVANWRMLRGLVAPAECAAVVKADAYGLGASRVAPALFAAGCRRFFVAHFGEAAALRGVLPAAASLYVMHGVFAGLERECVERGIVPVVNGAEQLGRMAALARHLGRRLGCVLQVDTGMARFGFAPDALPEAEALAPLAIEFVMSHLACADAPEDPANEAQRALFARLCGRLPPAPASLAASSGIFLGGGFHGALVRPGAALYGVAPQSGRPNPLHPVVRLEAKIVQVREVAAGTPVGYGHTAHTGGPARLATIAVGYADGFLRSASNRGSAEAGGALLPILGRVSMDSIVLDASAAPPGAVAAGGLVTLVGGQRSLDAVAADAGTIGYELLTSLGARYHRRYLPVVTEESAS